MELLGNRILIKLDPQPAHAEQASGLLLAHYALEETDGGRMGTTVSNVKYLSKGVVVSISALAEKRLVEEGTSLSTGDRVMVPPSTVSPQYQFFTDRESVVLEFDGHIVIPHSLIEAKI